MVLSKYTNAELIKLRLDIQNEMDSRCDTPPTLLPAFNPTRDFTQLWKRRSAPYNLYLKHSRKYLRIIERECKAVGIEAKEQHTDYETWQMRAGKFAFRVVYTDGWGSKRFWFTDSRGPQKTNSLRELLDAISSANELVSTIDEPPVKDAHGFLM